MALRSRKKKNTSQQLDNSEEFASTKVAVSQTGEDADIENDLLSLGRPSLQELFAPTAVDEQRDFLYLGEGSFARVFALTKYPREVYLGWLNDVFAVGNVDLSVHLLPIPDRVVIKQLTQRVVSAYSQLVLEQKKGSVERLPELQAVIRDLEALREAIQTNRDRMIHAGVFINVWGKNEEDLDARCDEVEGILARKAAEIRPLAFRQLDALKSVLPLGHLAVGGKGIVRNFTSGGAMTLMPVTASELSHPSGAFLGFTTSGAPVFYDPFIGPPWLPNPHIAVFGYTGAGKSVSLKVFIGRLSLNGVKTVVLDPEGEYRKPTTELWDGEVITVEPGRMAGINPFDVLPEKDPETGKLTVNIADKVTDIRALLSTMVRSFGQRDLSPVETSIAETLVRELYAERDITSDPHSLYEIGKQMPDGSYAVGRVYKDMPTLSDLVKKMEERFPEETKELRIVLNPFLRGNSLGMFDCQTNRDIQAPVVTFDLSRIKDDFTKLYAMFVLLTWIWQRFALGQEGKKMIVLDEAWMFAKWKESAQFLETIARRGRKHSTGLVVASQHIEEFIGREEGRAVISSCATRLLLGQNPTVAKEVAETFKLPTGADERLMTYSNGRGILVAGSSMAEIQIVTLPYEQQYIFTNVAV